MRKAMIFISWLYAILFCCSCSGDKNVNCVSNHIDPKYEYYKSILDDGEYCFIFGTDGDSQDYRTKETVLYKKSPGSDFVLMKRIKGQTRVGAIFGKYIYLINEVFPMKLSFSDSKSIFLKLNTETDQVEKVADMGNILIKDMTFDSDSVCYAAVRFSNYYRDGGFLKTVDGSI